ncbi:DUF1801 domain-containing protein [Pedobacter sp. Hv1]|uniref:DUF1801 domain-containing protein n=1 Tax=Pedobacter sp. Hv1 TaxID=1740090 RepID=UPI0006D8C076|nr:DUF1801 domain-containing protein [Pedobacter sp. Hv1]KQC00318.1 hypothetical protein AQF98_12585 [Pedobacter sp. Hv1]
MAKPTAQEQVNAHIDQLDPQIKDTIAYLRTFILGIDPEIGEQIKWNSLSFYYTGEMKPFDPKTYQRDLLVCNLHKGRIMLVFPTGARVEDSSGLLEGKYTDGRRMVTFKDLDDVKAKENDLRSVIKKWLDLIEK